MSRKLTKYSYRPQKNKS